MATDKKSKWPWWGQLILAVVALFLALSLLIALPVASVLWLGDGGGQQAGVWEPMIASLLALTSLLVTGTFIFMTFRIDRGTRRRAERTARSTAEKLIPEIRVQMMASADRADSAAVAAEQSADEAKDSAENAGHAEEAAAEFLGKVENAYEEMLTLQEGPDALKKLVSSVVRKEIEDRSWWRRLRARS